MYINKHIYTYINIYIYIYIYIFIHIYIHIYMQTHTHTHTHKCHAPSKSTRLKRASSFSWSVNPTSASWCSSSLYINVSVFFVCVDMTSRMSHMCIQPYRGYLVLQLFCDVFFVCASHQVSTSHVTRAFRGWLSFQLFVRQCLYFFLCVRDVINESRHVCTQPYMEHTEMQHQRARGYSSS